VVIGQATRDVEPGESIVIALDMVTAIELAADGDRADVEPTVLDDDPR
jgi:hypothetical protein